MSDWTNKHLVGRVTLHPRALCGLKDAKYKNVELVYRSLLVLAYEYRNQRLGREGSRDAFEKRIAELGLRGARFVAKERAGEQKDDYYVRFPTPSGPRRFLEWHLRQGQARDDRHCLAIYFFRDDDT